jgi:hypothetical protein
LGGTVVSSAGNLSGGTINNSGTLNVTGGAFGNATTTFNQSGTSSVSNGATNSVGNLNVNGGTLNLATASDKLSVNKDYNNANFGTGNSFNRLANVTGSGAIIAAGDAKQGLTGNIVGGGTTNGNATLLALNTHVGVSVTQNYQVVNTGTTGPDIRGAIQTGAPGGGNITDARLTGSGVNASNYTGGSGLATGANTGNLSVTFTGATVGALSGQSVQIVDNFGDSQNLAITGTAYNYADAALKLNTGSSSSGSGLGLSPDGTAATTYTLNLGHWAVGSGTVNAYFNELNIPTIADLLGGTWGSTGSTGSLALSFTGLNDITGVNRIVGGGSSSSLSGFSVSTSSVGTFAGTATFTWDGFNANINGGWTGTSSGQGISKTIVLNITGDVYNPGAGSIPEPGILGLFGTASALAWLNLRRRKTVKA